MKTLMALALSVPLLTGLGACSERTPSSAAAPAKAAAPGKQVKQWYCPMDKEVVSDKPGQTCPKCGMKLEPKPAS
jgi:hypothetical protein